MQQELVLLLRELDPHPPNGDEPRALVDRGVRPYQAVPWDGTERSAVEKLRDIAKTDPNPVTRKIAADGLDQYSRANVTIQDVYVNRGTAYEGVAGSARGTNVELYQRGVAYDTAVYGGDATQNAAAGLKHELTHTAQPPTYTKIQELEARQSDYFIRKAGGQDYGNPLIGGTAEVNSHIGQIEIGPSYQRLPAGAPSPATGSTAMPSEAATRW